jgi:hypothetical protein
MVLEARIEWHYAHPEDLHVWRVPSDLEALPGVGMVLDAGQLGGPAYAIPFIGYLDHPREPIVRALRSYRVRCAGKHRDWPEHRGRAVCAELLWSVVANGNPLAEAAEAVEVSLERAEALLGEALRSTWVWRAREANAI